ncbi:hypothetical protein DSO57_1032673 [Entomophthora muscae]|uniref:Uncharacterized protein n=1 Tax=Entomophthora muscae TaxID=34485 RepID=A0ACC2TND1_9FUNG|nr:hypothetical protein DSO57_1032673 [Entomophthora muscae]
MESKKILVPLVKFVCFTLAPTLLLIWSTSPKLWTCLFSSAYLAGENLSQLLYLLNDLPGKANFLLSMGENLVCSLTYDKVEFALLPKVVTSHHYRASQTSTLMEPEVHPPIDSVPFTSGVAPGRTSCLVAGTLLMSLNSYL